MLTRNGHRPQLRILHTSDLHLRKLGDKACQAMESIVDLAIDSKVDLVIVAGDLFDEFIATDDLVNFAIDQLRRLPVDVVILPGNHDCLVPDSVFWKQEKWLELKHIQIFREPEGETFSFPDLALNIWGKPIISFLEDCRPMAGVPTRRIEGNWHIAVAHGYYADGAPPPFPRLGITQEEIDNSSQDYIALGHWDRYKCLCESPVTAYYCDSPAAAYPYNNANIVDLSPDTGVKVTRHTLSGVY